MVKNLPANAGDKTDVGSIPGSGRSPGGGHGNSLQYSCLENPRDRGAQGLKSIGSQRVRHYQRTITTSDDLQSFMYKNLNTDNMPFVFRPVSIMIIMKHLLIDK